MIEKIEVTVGKNKIKVTKGGKVAIAINNGNYCITKAKKTPKGVFLLNKNL